MELDSEYSDDKRHLQRSILTFNRNTIIDNNTNRVRTKSKKVNHNHHHNNNNNNLKNNLTSKAINEQDVNRNYETSETKQRASISNEITGNAGGGDLIETEYYDDNDYVDTSETIDSSSSSGKFNNNNNNNSSSSQEKIDMNVKSNHYENNRKSGAQEATNSKETMLILDGLPGYPAPDFDRYLASRISSQGQDAELAVNSAGFIIDTGRTVEGKPDEMSPTSSNAHLSSIYRIPKKNDDGSRSDVGDAALLPTFVHSSPIPLEGYIAEESDTSAHIPSEYPVRHSITLIEPQHTQSNDRLTVPVYGNDNVMNKHFLSFLLTNKQHNQNNGGNLNNINDQGSSLPSPASYPILKPFPMLIPFHLARQKREIKPNKKMDDENEKDDKLKSSASVDYFNFNDHNLGKQSRLTFLNQRRRALKSKIEDDDEDDEDEQKNDKRSLFNFRTNAYQPQQQQQQQQPIAKSYARDQKPVYTDLNKRKITDYGILGSGNFEIIRGGFFDQNELANSDSNGLTRQRYNSDVPLNSNANTNNDNDHNDNNEALRDRGHDDYDGENAEKNIFAHEDELFGATPILGFQGYDNFQAASMIKKGPNGQVRYDGGGEGDETLPKNETSDMNNEKVLNEDNLNNHRHTIKLHSSENIGSDSSQISETISPISSSSSSTSAYSSSSSSSPSSSSLPSSSVTSSSTDSLTNLSEPNILPSNQVNVYSDTDLLAVS